MNWVYNKRFLADAIRSTRKTEVMIPTASFLNKLLTYMWPHNRL